MGFKELLGRLGCLGPQSRRTPENPLGRNVSRHFKFLGVLGVGSWASVYLVERHFDGKRYALKQTFITDLDETLRWVAVNEIRILASLDPHPHVLTCKEGFLDGQHLCIVMDVMPNGELAQIIQRHAEKDAPIPEDDIWSYFIQIVMGLKFLHANGILHRDLKPQNILISAEGRLKLADLGISHVVKSPTGSTKVRIGTPNYMCPEMWRRDPYSFPADIWALGCTLHELCTRKQLFMADNEPEVERKVIVGAVPPISKRYSQELRDLVHSLLEYYPDDRPTIDEVLNCSAVQSRLMAMAGDSWASMKGIGIDLDCCQRAGSKILDPIEIPSDLSQLNLHLPPSRYSIGEGLVNMLRAESLPEELQTPTPHVGVMSTSSSGTVSLADTAYDGSGSSPPLSAARRGAQGRCKARAQDRKLRWAEDLERVSSTPGPALGAVG